LYTKGTDTMDVWFDSGSSWAALQDKLGFPVDLYIEGQDQHRGWFQSSLITSVAARGQAPYKGVMTHGFCVDDKGRKMSKSEGNVIDPYSIIEGGKDAKKEPSYGADVLRLWVASVDFTGDVAISQSIMSRVAENMKKIRNRARFLLGNIYDFDPKCDSVPYDELSLLDRYTIYQAEQAFDQIQKAYTAYSLSSAITILMDFLQENSALYLEIAKDRLYISEQKSHRRRSCQTVLRWLTENIARAIAPVLCHLAEDIYQALPGKQTEPSIFLTGWCASFPGSKNQITAEMESLEEVLRAREPVNLALESTRKDKVIGSFLEADLVLYTHQGSKLQQCIEKVSSQAHSDINGLTWLFGVSKVDVKVLEANVAPEIPEGAYSADSEALGVTAVVTRTKGTKCQRCRCFGDSNGSSQAHPNVCQRCIKVLECVAVDTPSLQTA